MDRFYRGSRQAGNATPRIWYEGHSLRPPSSGKPACLVLSLPFGSLKSRLASSRIQHLHNRKGGCMTQAQLEVRKERSENGALIASATAEGFRVYAVQNPSKAYLVKKDGDQWTCTCPDFEFHKGDTTWRCKHVLAVAPWPKPEETLPVE